MKRIANLNEEAIGVDSVTVSIDTGAFEYIHLGSLLMCPRLQVDET